VFVCRAAVRVRCIGHCFAHSTSRTRYYLPCSVVHPIVHALALYNNHKSVKTSHNIQSTELLTVMRTTLSIFSFNFRYLIKADDDTFMCFQRMAAHVHALPAETRAKIYGGIPTACGLDSNPFIGRVIKDSGHKW
jgi:hypothetical protein